MAWAKVNISDPGVVLKYNCQTAKIVERQVKPNIGYISLTFIFLFCLVVYYQLRVTALFRLNLHFVVFWCSAPYRDLV